MIRPRHAVLAFLVSIAAITTGCNDNPVGRICDLGAEGTGTGQLVIASPSLDCVSRTCLFVVPERPAPEGNVPLPPNSGLCTAECSADSDCDRVPESPCLTGFTCGVPRGNTVGRSCCKKYCICKDYIVLPEDGKLPAPAACDATKPENDCCNLPGRLNNAAYPGCKNFE
jgi:hypothetical protein